MLAENPDAPVPRAQVRGLTGLERGSEPRPSRIVVELEEAGMRRDLVGRHPQGVAVDLVDLLRRQRESLVANLVVKRLAERSREGRLIGARSRRIAAAHTALPRRRLPLRIRREEREE